MLIADFINFVERLGRHDDFLAWLRTLPPTSTAAEAWASCQNGEWLAQLVGALYHKGLVTKTTSAVVACAAARTALVHTEEKWPRITIETAERWCRGGATDAEVRDAADIAYAVRDRAWNHADTAFAEHRAYHAAAALAADAAANAAHANAFGASAAAIVAAAPRGYHSNPQFTAADNAAAAAARRAEIADAVRAVVPWTTVEAALREAMATAV